MLLKRIIIILLFATLCFGMVEQSYRFFASGSAAFFPARFNSLNMLLLSGLTKRSEYPSVFFELKPDIDTLFQAVAFKTNSMGMADREYSLKKPENTLRIAVLGSSWTMATGVQQDSSYHSLLEAELSGESDQINYEFLNFGVEYYGLRELTCTARHRVIKWDPDIIVVAITPFTAQLRWEEASGTESLPEKTTPFFQSYALRELDSLTGMNIYARGLPNRDVLKFKEQDIYLAQLERAFSELHQVAAEKGVPLMVMWLSYRKPPPETEDALRSLSEEYDAIFVDTFNDLRGSDSKNLHTARFNKHPNSQGHQIIAQSLKEAMHENKLLPGL